LAYLHLLAHQVAPEHHGMLRKMTSASRRLFDLVDGLLEQARIASGRLTTCIEPLDLAELADGVMEEARTLAEEKGLVLRTSVVRDLPLLATDRRLLGLILANIVDNAVKFTERGGVELLLSHRDGEHQIVVEDSGRGIPPDRRTSVFEPFEQVEPIRDKHTPGVGLGLAREMVGALGGRIGLQSEVGVGTTVTVILPPAAEQAARATA
jgi:signal transduction histidine kinase